MGYKNAGFPREINLIPIGYFVYTYYFEKAHCEYDFEKGLLLLHPTLGGNIRDIIILTVK